MSRRQRVPLTLILVVFFVILGLFAPWLAPYDPAQTFPEMSLKPPFWFVTGDARFWLGTDDLGRDLLSRLIYGARISMGLGFLVVIFSVLFGGTLGALAGFFGGRIDRTVSQAVDVLMSLPSLLLAIVIVAIAGPGLKTALWAVVIVTLPGYIRVMRAAVMVERSRDYVTAATSFGANRRYLIFRTILPNCWAPLIVQSTLGFSDGVLNLAALSFLGLGAQPPIPEWGVMLGDSRAFIETAWWMVTLPGLCLLLVVLGFNLLGDRLRDSLDSKLKANL